MKNAKGASVATFAVPAGEICGLGGGGTDIDMGIWGVNP